VIERLTRVRHHPAWVWALLRHRMGWSVQRPVRRPPSATRPRSTAGSRSGGRGFCNAQRRRACLVFFDETALSLTPNVRRTWAPVGHPAVLEHRFNWKKASMAAAVCYGVRGGGAQLAFHLQPGNYNTDRLIQVLAELRRSLGGEKATLLWDGLPAYAPELNPVEGLWSWLKGTLLANLVCPTLREVAEQAELGIEHARQTPHLAYSFLRRTGLSVS
jgi:DDE superfamily endonuclease/Winged helix-turn helix